jgi:Aerotolerance regulator N-terminal
MDFSFFVNPWFMAAGGALISSPILIHLINRMRFKRIRWAAMEFLLKSQKRNRRRLIIEQLILLLLRILLVLLAAFLLARYLYSGAEDQGGTKHFVLLDDGLSMTDHWFVEGKPINCFDKAREGVVAIAQEAQKANSAQEMVVYLLSDLETPVFDKRLNNATVGELTEILDKHKPTALHLLPAAGIEKGAAYLKSQPQGSKILHYVGDFRENKWVSGAEGKSTAEAVDKTVEAGIHVSLFDAAYPSRADTRQIVENHDNLAIVDLHAETRIAAEGVPIEFTVRLWNYGIGDKKTHLHVFVDGEEQFTGSKDTGSIPSGSYRDEKFTLLFQKKKPSQDIRPNDPPDVREQKRRAEQEFIHIGAVISGEDTGLQADNYRDMVIEVRKKVPALLIDGNDGKEGLAEGGDVVHVDVALASARAYDIERRTVDELDKINLDLYPSIFLLNVGTLVKGDKDEKGKALVVKLADYVKRGGSIAYFLGPKAYVPFYNETLHKGKWKPEDAQPFIAPGLFPVLLQPNPTPPLTEEERVERRQKDEQPKILFRFQKRNKDEQIPSSDPESIISSIAAQASVFRYLLIDRYYPARPRFEWDTNPEEKANPIIVLPNRDKMEAVKPEAQRYLNQAIELTKDLAAKDKEFVKYEEALTRVYFREVRSALESDQLFNVAAAFDHLMNDVGIKGDDKKPPMTNLWAEPTMQALGKQIQLFIEKTRYGDPLVVARPYGKGRIVACLTPAGTSSKWNDWGGGSQATWTYPMFLMDLQRYLTSGGDDLNHLVGEKLSFQLDAARYKNTAEFTKLPQPDPDSVPKAGQLGTRTPSKIQKQPLPEIVNDSGNLLDFQLTETKQAGVYSFKFAQQAGDVEEDRIYAFNVDAAAESDLKRGAREKIERNPTNADSRRGKVVLRSLGEEPFVGQVRVPDASESPWLYLLILVILIVEQALAVHLSFHLRDSAAAPAAATVPVAA